MSSPINLFQIGVEAVQQKRFAVAAVAADPDPVALAPDTSPAAPSAALNDTEAAQLLKQGNKALKTGKFAEAVAHLETYVQHSDPQHKDYAQAQMWLVKAYKGNDQKAAAIALCRELVTHEKPFVQI